MDFRDLWQMMIDIKAYMKTIGVVTALIAMLFAGQVIAGEPVGIDKYSSDVTSSLLGPAIKFAISEDLIKEETPTEGPEAKSGKPPAEEPPLGAQISVSVLDSILSFFSNPVYVGNVIRMISDK